MVDKQSEPVAVVISPEVSERQREREAEQDWVAIDRIRERNKDKDPEVELPVITRVVEEVRQDRYERKQRRAEDRR